MKFLLVLLFFSFLPRTFGQQNQITRDAIILRDGRTFVGKIVESKDDSVRIQLVDGSVEAFHKKDVVARTKENVLPTYMAPEERSQPLLLVAPAVGKGLNKLYGYGFGVKLNQRLVSGFVLGLTADYYAGASRTLSFAVVTLVPGNPPTGVSNSATISEKTKSVMFFLTAGKDVPWRGMMARPYLGFGIGRLTSDITYVSGSIPPGETLEGSLPPEGSRNLGFVGLGLELLIPISSSWYVQPGVRYQTSFDAIGGSLEEQNRDLVFIEGNNSGLALSLSIAFQVN